MQSKSHEVTAEQQKIFDYEPFGMVITAPAGCGKTEALAYGEEDSLSDMISQAMVGDC